MTALLRLAGNLHAGSRRAAAAVVRLASDGWRAGVPYLLLAAVAAVGFVVVYAFRPLTIEFMHSTYDDALYIRLGMSIAEGLWLGPYDQLTLAKGPGYPVFLALNSWLGLPVSVGQALFHCLGAAVLAWSVVRLTGSRLLGLLLFVVLLWNPWFVTRRITREGIYTAQSMLFAGLALYALFVARSLRSGVIAGALAGIVLGWFWLTREEGLLIVPVIVLLLAAAWWLRRLRSLPARPLVAIVLVAGMGFVAVHAAFRTMNFLYYKSFAGVDMRERNFVAALGAIQSVRVGEEKIFVPMTRAARERVYEVSPTFASLRNYFDPPTGSPWSQGCDWWHWTCGEIGSGWFLWALRAAAAVNGHYRTPEMASKFFGTLAAEVNAACDAGKLRCERSWLPYMPSMNSAQLAWWPRELYRGWSMMGSAPPPDGGGSAGDAISMQKALKFLNYPVHMPSAGSPPLRYVFSGWYWNGRADWFQIVVSGQGGSGTLVRSGSPDLAAAFKSEAAGQQRFRLEVSCPSTCSVHFKAADGTEVPIPIDQLMKNISARHQGVHLGGGTLWFDAFDAEKPFLQEPRIVASRHTRAALSGWYARVMPPFLDWGLAAFGAALLPGLLRRRSPHVVVALTLAATLWIVVLGRLGALSLIAISSFPAVNALYMSPAIYFAPAAALCSFWALAVALRHLLLPRAAASPGAPASPEGVVLVP